MLCQTFQKFAVSKGGALVAVRWLRNSRALIKRRKGEFLPKAKRGKPTLDGVFLYKHFVSFRRRSFDSPPTPNFCTAAKVPKMRCERTPLADTPRFRFGTGSFFTTSTSIKCKFDVVCVLSIKNSMCLAFFAVKTSILFLQVIAKCHFRSRYVEMSLCEKTEMFFLKNK